MVTLNVKHNCRKWQLTRLWQRTGRLALNHLPDLSWVIVSVSDAKSALCSAKRLSGVVTVKGLAKLPVSLRLIDTGDVAKPFTSSRLW